MRINTIKEFVRDEIVPAIDVYAHESKKSSSEVAFELCQEIKKTTPFPIGSKLE